MASLITGKEQYGKQEEKLFIELDKGIDDMEQGNRNTFKAVWYI